MFTFPDYTYSKAWKDSTKFFWPDQATLFSSNQCLIDRTVGHHFTKCRTAPFICRANGIVMHYEEHRTYEESLKQCELINGNLCKQFYEQIYEQADNSFMFFKDTPRLNETNEILAEYGSLWTDLKRGKLYSLIHGTCALCHSDFCSDRPLITIK